MGSSIIGSSEFKRNLYGWFGVAYGKKSLGEIFFKMLLRKKYCGFAVYLQIKSLKKILNKMRSSTSLLGRVFIGDRIGDARNLK